MVLRQISVVLRQVSIASRHSEGVQVAWRWCGNQNDDGVGTAMGGVEANVDGADKKLYGVEANFGCVPGLRRDILRGVMSPGDVGAKLVGVDAKYGR